MNTISHVLALCMVVVCASIVSAQTTKPPSDPLNRQQYVIEKKDGGFVRLNRRTGQTSFCKVNQGNLICRMSADERTAYEAEISDLNDRITRLEVTVEALKNPGSSKRLNEKPSKKSQKLPKNDAPDDRALEEEFDKAMDFAQDAMRRFFDVVKDLKNKYEDDR